MFMEVVVKEWDVFVFELIIEQGIIYYKSSGKFIGYGVVVIVVVILEVFEEVELKDFKDFKIIGISCKNVDVCEIVIGKLFFGLDVQKEGMCIVMIVYLLVFG